MNKTLSALIIPPLSIFSLAMLFGHKVYADATPGPDVILPFDPAEFSVEAISLVIAIVVFVLGFQTLWRLTDALRNSWLFLLLSVTLYSFHLIFDMLSALNLFRVQIFFEITQFGMGLGLLGTVISFRHVFKNIDARRGK